MLRANHKTAIAHLRTAPNAPPHFPIGREFPDADPSSFQPESPPSAPNPDESTRTAAGDPISSRAQVACSRTSGEESENAAVRVGTASSEPQLPNATHTLRSNPERPALSTGESAKKRRNPRPDNDKSRSASATNGGPSSSDLAEYAASEEGTENLRVIGHTSWEVCPPSRYEIPLSGGRYKPHNTH